MTSQQQKPPGLPNPYAGGSLPNPYALPTVAEAAPVKFSEEQAKAAEMKSTASRFHNPHLIKRPQAKAGAAVKKPALPKPAMASSSSDTPTATFQQPGLDYFRSTVDDDNAVIEYNRELRREEAKKKKDRKKFDKAWGAWRPDQQYKIRHPTKVGAYKASGGYAEKLQDFHNFLRAARKHASPRESRDDSEEHQQTSQSKSEPPSVAANPMFAPPPIEDTKPSSPPPTFQNPMFAPPPMEQPVASEPSSDAMDIETSQPRASSPPTALDMDETPEEVYERRKLLAQMGIQPSAPPPPTVTDEADPPPPPPPAPAYNPTISAPPVRYNPTISAEPVHYARPVSSHSNDGPNDRPAKKQKIAEPPKQSKAALMMAKMGYVKGQGLGKNSDGVITHLEVKARKDASRNQPRDEFDENGGKNVKSAPVFDIMGGKRNVEKEESRFGEPSRVVVTWGCVDGVDFGVDAERDDGGVRQEMGDVFNSKFGRVEKIHVNLQSSPGTVYIQFGDVMSALNAVNRFSEGYEFQGRKIRAQYYHEGRFENSIYDH